MNTTTQENHLRQRPQYGGNSITESESPIDDLFEIYLNSGLSWSDAWDAALWEYTHGFNAAR
jgi:hypothetical protein